MQEILHLIIAALGGALVGGTVTATIWQRTNVSIHKQWIAFYERHVPKQSEEVSVHHHPKKKEMN